MNLDSQQYKHTNQYPNIFRSSKSIYEQIFENYKSESFAFCHHYQGSIDFNTVNIHLTVGMYFLVSTGN